MHVAQSLQILHALVMIDSHSDEKSFISYSKVFAVTTYTRLTLQIWEAKSSMRPVLTLCLLLSM